jgi:hypothetical protein
MTNYKGIDYGLGRTNKDHAASIRYGVISQNEVLQAWSDSSEPNYGTPCENLECPECGASVEHPEAWSDTVQCECGHSFECELPDFAEPLGFTYNGDGYQASAGECGDIFITKAPFFTYAQFCSPCAPGACYLLNTLEQQDPDNRAYCFGHDWFEDGQAPYPVYSVATGELVLPEKQ